MEFDLQHVRRGWREIGGEVHIDLLFIAGRAGKVDAIDQTDARLRHRAERQWRCVVKGESRRRRE